MSRSLTIPATEVPSPETTTAPIRCSMSTVSRSPTCVSGVTVTTSPPLTRSRSLIRICPPAATDTAPASLFLQPALGTSLRALVQRVRGLAGGEREGGDARVAGGAGLREIHIGVPEGAVVQRAEGQVAVAPPAGRGLRAGTGDDARLTAGERAGRVGGQPPGVPDRREGVRTADRVPGRQVAEPVHRHRGVESAVGIRRERTLLEQLGRTGDAADLVPPDARTYRLARVGVDRVVEHQRLVVAEVAVRQAEHRQPGKRRQPGRRT